MTPFLWWPLSEEDDRRLAQADAYRLVLEAIASQPAAGLIDTTLGNTTIGFRLDGRSTGAPIDVEVDIYVRGT